MAKIELLVGNIGSGRRRFAMTRAREGAVVVSRDLMNRAFHGGVDAFDPELRDVYMAVAGATIVAAVRDGRDVVILDDELHRREVREQYTRLANLADTEVVAVVFDRISPEEHARREFSSGMCRPTINYDQCLQAATRIEDSWEDPDVSESLASVVPASNFTMSGV